MYFQQEAALPLQVVADGHSTATALVTSTPALAATVVVWTLGEIVLDILWAGCAGLGALAAALILSPAARPRYAMTASRSTSAA